MRFFLIFLLPFIITSCNNDLSQIGQNLVPSDRYVEVAVFEIEDTYTIKIDTFPTSNPSVILAGKVTDKTTGTTSSLPYFQVAPTTQNEYPNIQDEYRYDSLILNIPPSKIIAGDSTTVQTFHLYRLSEYPIYDIHDPFYYNVDSLKWGEKLSTVRFYPQDFHLTRTYFKIEETESGVNLGRELYNMARNRDVLMEPEERLRFITEYLNGLVIVPDENNTDILMNIPRDSLFLQCYYSSGEISYSFKLPLVTYNQYDTEKGWIFYPFTNIKHEPTPEYAGITRTNGLKYNTEHRAVIQGLNGYMLKMNLPYIPNFEQYKTIIRAEIEFRPDVFIYDEIPTASSLQVFPTDENNKIMGYYLTDISGNPIVSSLLKNSSQYEDQRYRIDITDYYSDLATHLQLDQDIHIFVGLPDTYVQVSPYVYSFGGNIANSFSRVILSDDQPVLRIYYAKYK